MFCAVTERGARAVHGGVPTTDDHHVAANAERLAKVGALHKVDAVDEAFKITSWNVECNRIHGPRADSNRAEVLLQLLKGDVASDLRVVNKLHAELLNQADVGLNCFAWQAECWDANEHGAAAVRQAVIDGDLVALDGKFARHRETSRARTDHRNALGARRDLRRNVRDPRCGVPLNEESLHCADGERAINVATTAGALARGGADVGAHRGDRIRLAGEEVPLFELPFGGEVQVPAAVGANGAGLLALNVALKPRSIDWLNQKVLRLEGHDQPFLPTVGPRFSEEILAGAPRGRLRREGVDQARCASISASTSAA